MQQMYDPNQQMVYNPNQPVAYDPNQQARYQQQQYQQQYQQPQQTVGGEQYEKVSHVAHIRKRPDTYIGANTGVTSENFWVAKIVGPDNIKISCPSIQIAVAVNGISKEVFDNASDNVERSRLEGIDPGSVDVFMMSSDGVNIDTLSVRNYGKHIPIVIHHIEKIWVPQMIFGVLLTSDNYNDADTISRYKIGRNGYGVKLANIFSSGFMIEIVDPINRLKYTQQWSNAMEICSEPVIVPYNGPGYTQVTLKPDFQYFYGNNPPRPSTFLESMPGVYLNRAMGMSFAAQVTTSFDGIFLDYRDAMKYFNAHFETSDPQRKFVYWCSDDKRNEFVIADTPGKGFINAFVNGTPVHQGEHVNEYLRVVFEAIAAKFEKEHSKKVRVDHLKKHVGILLRVTLDKPEFDSQIKRKLTKPKPKVNIPPKIQQAIIKDKWELDEELRKMFNMKSKKGPETRKDKSRVFKVTDAIQASSGDPFERLKCTLILTEGETGKTLALKGFKYLPGGLRYNGIYPLRGKVMNTDRHSEEKGDRNKELSDIMKILGADKDTDYSLAENFKKLNYGKIAIMTDADYDGSHIAGSLIDFICKKLKSIAPFEFMLHLLTPVIVATRPGHQKMVFYQIKQFKKWEATIPDIDKWEVLYKKGLGSWDTDKKVLQELFQQPIILTFMVDPTTDDMLKLAFDKKCTDQRKQWISAHDPNSECILTNPRPITHFFNEEFRDYSKDSVLRAIPFLMDGMKRVHRKVLYAMLLKFPKRKEKYKKIKVTQFGGFVMEKTHYHHGEDALYHTIIGMGQKYVTGPNNIPLVWGEGNFGDRRKRGADQSPARYLTVELHPITHFIYRKEDEPLWEIVSEDGEPAEPKVMYPIVPMCIINKCEGIATGWSTKIPCHDPRLVLEWVAQWIQERKSKRHIPKEELIIDVSCKPELVPFWRDYTGEIIRIKNTPFEVYKNVGKFNYQFHITNVVELPAEYAPETFKTWGEREEDKYKEKPEEAVLRSFQMVVEPPAIDFRITGMHNPTLEKLKLIRTISLSNLTLVDRDGIPKKYSYIFEILCEWCSDRLEIYERRRLNLIKEYEAELRLKTLKYMFIEDVVEKRLELRNRPKSEIHAYMKAKGYPYNKKAHGDDFLLIPIGTITKEKVIKLKKEIGIIYQKLEYFKTALPEDLWTKDLEELRPEIHKLYATPLE